MKALVCLVIIAIFVVVLWPEPKPPEPAPLVAERPPPPVSTPVPVTASAAPNPRHMPTISRDDLVILHGQIVNRVPTGLLVSCTAPEGGIPGAPQDRIRYGPLMMSVGGQWQPANWTPDVHAEGMVILTGELPQNVIMPTSAINLIVATGGKNMFTTEYEAAPEKPAGWMWKKRGNPLEPPLK